LRVARRFLSNICQTSSAGFARKTRQMPEPRDQDIIDGVFRIVSESLT
jgi:hypothetical protein